MALCRVTGTLYVPSGEPAASYVIYLTRINKSVVADYNGSVVPEVVRVPAGRDGSVDFEILTGSYYGIARPCGSAEGFAFNFAVPDAATAAFESCIDAIAPPSPPPEWLQRVEDAVADAEQSAIDAQAAATGAAADVRAEVAADADRAEAAADALSDSVSTITELVGAEREAEDGGTVLIGYQNGRAALVQREDGLDFVPSDKLKDVLIGPITGASETPNGGTVLIGYQNGRAALVQREDGLDFVPSDKLKDVLIGPITGASETPNGVPLIGYENGRVALFQREDGLDFVPSPSLIARLPNGDPNPILSGKIQINSVNGQSHSTGGPWDEKMSRAVADLFTSAALLQVDGLRRGDGASAASTNGPAVYGYDQSVPGTGIGIGQPGGNNIGLPFATFATLHLHRRDAGVPNIPTITSTHGSAGIPLLDMDPDPNTGNGSLNVWNNFTYWTQEALRLIQQAGLEIVPGWHVFNHAGAGKTFMPGVYKAQWLALQAYYLEHWTSLGLTQPRYILSQGGGGTNTTNAAPGNWANADDQLDLVEMGAAVLGCCDYWYPVYDGSGHWNAYQTTLAGETLAWAMSEIEAGRKWSIHRPKIRREGPGVMRLRFDSLRDDEHLQIENPAKYGGVGIDEFLGLELDGGTIAAVKVEGWEVEIRYSGTPARLKYARQIQNLSGDIHAAHRGLLRTSLRKRSKFWPDDLLVRPIPTFTINLEA